MEIINHRINTITDLQNTPIEFGVEIDIRSYADRLVLHHEPFEKGQDFAAWLTHYKHQTLILNVKEEGLEDKIIDLMTKHKIEKYFFLDLSFPFLIKKSNQGLTKIAARLSEFESIETVLAIKDRVEWVWIDCFSHYPLTPEIYQQIKTAGLKICLVSPELVHGELAKPKEARDFLMQNNFEIEAVCTKQPQVWKEEIA